jgi:protein-L-isoaspartate(D-aspartate) O-methyltransferase
MDESQAAALRAEMVERQLRARGIADESVLAVMGALPRELFVPAANRARAYADDALPIAAGQSISQPYMVARMTELLEPRPGMRVLEVGTGSGYQAAVLARLGCRVISVERHAELADAARLRLAALGLGEAVRVAIGDGSVGWPDAAPFDGILVTAGAPRVPPALPAQLAEGGRLVVPIGPHVRQELMLGLRRGSDMEWHRCGPCVFVPLVGAGGFSEDQSRRRRIGRWVV